MFERKKLVIFDMDGVLADTEPVHEAAKHEMLRRMGVSECFDFSQVAGQSVTAIWKPVLQKYELQKSMAEIEQLQYELVLAGLQRQGKIGRAHV